jgi:[acyl-carrier-protein] S-malonyltransferase
MPHASLAIVFPGQGSQSVGMMKGFADTPVIEKTFREASAIAGVDYWKMVNEGPPEALNQTVNTQPLMLVAGVACWRAWHERGGAMPQWFAGHSLGEYSALVAAESLRFEDALPLVRFRAQSMQEAVPEGTGGIAAILGLDDAKLAEVCTEAAQGEVLEPANRRARHGAREGEGSQARRDVADERAIPLQPDEARRRAAARAPRAGRGARAGRARDPQPLRRGFR